MTQFDENDKLPVAVNDVVPWQLGPVQVAQDSEDVALLGGARGFVHGDGTFHIGCQGSVDGVVNPVVAMRVKSARYHLREEMNRALPLC